MVAEIDFELVAVEKLNILVHQANTPARQLVDIFENRLVDVNRTVNHFDGGKSADRHHRFDRLVVWSSAVLLTDPLDSR